MAITVDLSKGELHNVTIKAGKLCVRESLVRHTFRFNNLKGFFGEEVVHGFSVEDPNTTEILHYLFFRDTTSQVLTCAVTDESYELITHSTIGVIIGDPVLSHAVLNQEVHINGPGLKTPLYGFIGSGLIPATKVLSRNEANTPTIEVPLGIVTSFGDRMAIAQYNQVFFSDPGFRFRTFVGANVVTVPSKIYGLMQANNGALYIITAQDIYYITKDALGQGQLVYAFLGNIKGYEANDYRCAAVVGSALFTIGSQAINIVNGQSIGTMEVIKFDRKRYLSEVVGTADLKQEAKIWPMSNGFVLSSDGKLFYFDNDNKITSWIYANSGASINLVGVLKTRDGKNLFLTKDYPIELFGTGQDAYSFDSHPTGYACVSLDTEPRNSEMVRFITTISDNAGLAQQVAIRGQARSKVTPPAPNQTNIIDQSNWNESAYSAAETKSRRNGFAVRTDDISFEVGIQGATAMIGSVSIDIEPNQDKFRP